MLLKSVSNDYIFKADINLLHVPLYTGLLHIVYTVYVIREKDMASCLTLSSTNWKGSLFSGISH